MIESRLKALRFLSGNPARSQRAISEELNLSLGMVNGVINALIEGGYVKRRRLRGDGNGSLYEYIVTPEGSRKLMVLTCELLKKKSEEYEILAEEIEELREEIRSFDLAGQEEAL